MINIFSYGCTPKYWTKDGELADCNIKPGTWRVSLVGANTGCICGYGNIVSSKDTVVRCCATAFCNMVLNGNRILLTGFKNNLQVAYESVLRGVFLILILATNPCKKAN